MHFPVTAERIIKVKESRGKLSQEATEGCYLIWCNMFQCVPHYIEAAQLIAACLLTTIIYAHESLHERLIGFFNYQYVAGKGCHGSGRVICSFLCEE